MSDCFFVKNIKKKRISKRNPLALFITGTRKADCIDGKAYFNKVKVPRKVGKVECTAIFIRLKLLSIPRLLSVKHEEQH